MSLLNIHVFTRVLVFAQVDYGFAFRYPYWPNEAKEWITRERYGIDEQTVKEIANRGCYLVHKPCGEKKNIVV